MKKLLINWCKTLIMELIDNALEEATMKLAHEGVHVDPRVIDKVRDKILEKISNV